MELAEEEDAFDVFGYLKKLRQSRKGLVDNVVSKNSPDLYESSLTLIYKSTKYIETLLIDTATHFRRKAE